MGVTFGLLEVECKSLAELKGRPPGSSRGRVGTGRVLTHVKMEKKEKAMAARAASVPSFIGLSLGLDTCHWLARKQKPTNQRKAQKAVVSTRAGQKGPRVTEGEWGGSGGKRATGRGLGARLPHSPTPKGRGGGRGGAERGAQGR